MNTFFMGVLIFLASIAGIVLSFFSSVKAANFAAGERTGLWILGPEFTMIFGGIAGIVVLVLVGIVLACRKQTTFRTVFFALLFIPPIIVSSLSAAWTYFAEILPSERYQAEHRAMSDAMHQDPHTLETLIAKARAGRLSKAGRSVLLEEAQRSTRIKQEDMLFIVHYCIDDDSFVNAIMFDRSKVSEALFRNIYEHYKHMSTQVFQIIPRIALSEETPDDILEDIAEHNSRYPKKGSYCKSEMESAKETLLWKRSKGDPSAIDQLATDLRAGKSGEAERRVILRLLATGRITMVDLNGVVEQYLNDSDFILALMKERNIGADNIRKIYDRYKDGENSNLSMAASVISSIVGLDQTPSDVLQKIATHEVDKNGSLYPSYIIENAQGILRKRDAESPRR